jgi:hypothetical protein
MCESLQTPAGLFYMYELIWNEAVGFVPENEATYHMQSKGVGRLLSLSSGCGLGGVGPNILCDI